MKRKSKPLPSLPPKAKRKVKGNQHSIEAFLSQSSLMNVPVSTAVTKEEAKGKDTVSFTQIPNNKANELDVKKDRAKLESMLINKGLAFEDTVINPGSIQSSIQSQKAFDSLLFPMIIKTPLGISKSCPIPSIKKLLNSDDHSQLIVLSPKYVKDSVELEYQSKKIGYITKTVSYYLCRVSPHQAVSVALYLNKTNLEVVITVTLNSGEVKLKRIAMKEEKCYFYQVSYGKNYLGVSLIRNMLSLYKYSLNSQLELIDDNKLIKYDKSILEINNLIDEQKNQTKKAKEKENNTSIVNEIRDAKDTNFTTDIFNESLSNDNNDSDSLDDAQSETRKLYHSFLVSNYEHILAMITAYSFLFSAEEIEVAHKALAINAGEKALVLKFITRSSKWISQAKLGLNNPEDLNSLVTLGLIQSSNDTPLIENHNELFEYLYYLPNSQLKSIQAQLHQITKLKPSQVTANFIPEIFLNNSFYALDAYLDAPELCNAASQISQMITEYNFDAKEQKKLEDRSKSMETFSRHFKKELAEKHYAQSYISKNFNASNYRKVHLTRQNRSSKSLMILSIIQSVSAYMKDRSSVFMANFIQKDSNGDSINRKKEVIEALLKKFELFKLGFKLGKAFDCASRLFFFYSEYRDIKSIAKEFYGMESFEVYRNYLSEVILSSTKEKMAEANDESYRDVLKPIFTSEESFKLYDNLHQIKNSYQISSMTITSVSLNYSILSSLHIYLMKCLNSSLFNELFSAHFPSTEKEIEQTTGILIDQLKKDSANCLSDDFLSKYSPQHIAAELLTYYAELCEKSKEHFKANIIYLFMLLSSQLVKKRGQWWHRAILNFAHHLKLRFNAIQLLNLAHHDKTIKTGYLIKLKEYYLTFIQKKAKAKRIDKVLNALQDGLFISVNTDINAFDYKKFFRTITSESAVSYESKRRLYGIDKDIVSVEVFALNYYHQVHGYEGIHGENEIIPTLFNIFFWNAIYFDRVPYVFQSAYQAFPLDFFYPNFYQSRKEIIDSRLKEIASMTEKELIETISLVYLKKKNIKSVFINWNSLIAKKDTLIKIAIAITAPKLAAIFSDLSRNIKYLTKGMPDLFLWKKQESNRSIANSALIVEVKSVNDKLSDHQKFWLGLLSKADIIIEVLHIK